MATNGRGAVRPVPGIRKLAIEALMDILVGGSKPKAALEPLFMELEGRDRAFLMELVYGVLRRLRTIDWLLGKYLRNQSGLPLSTQLNLRVAAYQLFFTRVPDWAAVDEAVENELRQRGVVNAVLRNVVRGRPEIKKELEGMARIILDPKAEEFKRVGNLAIKESYPEWLVKRWLKRFPPEEAMKMAEAGNVLAPLTLRVNTLRATREEAIAKLSELGITVTPTSMSPVGLLVEEGRTYLDVKPLEGVISAQDEAAQLVAYMAEVQPGMRVLDACAAPGGKAGHMAELMGDKGEVVALDLEESRLVVLRENVKAMGYTCIKAVSGDLAAYKDEEGFDAVLLDAPCSSLGVLRRNPDVKNRHNKTDLPRFHDRQRSLLNASARLVKPGGILVYSVCSTEPEEGDDVVSSFLQSNKDFALKREVEFFKGMEAFSEGILRTFPHRHGTDGFFAARFDKAK